MPKPAMKWAGIVTALLLLLWSGTFLYWNLRIRQALRSFEERAEKLSPEDWEAHAMSQAAHDAMHDAGCRALPDLVQALSTSSQHKFLQAITFQLTLTMWSSDALEFLKDNRIRNDDSTSLREQKIARIRTWWGEKGGRYHHWWAVWSRRCEAPLPK